MRLDASRALAELAVRGNLDGPMLRLSGGNQQKALLAKWLQTEPALLLLHEPTQGVDVGAREAIFGLVRAAAARGCATVCASSDYEQLALICDRVLIFGEGVIVSELTGSEVTKEQITAQSLSSIAAVALSLRVLPRERGGGGTKVDVPGVALFTIAAGALT